MNSLLPRIGLVLFCTATFGACSHEPSSLTQNYQHAGFAVRLPEQYRFIEDTEVSLFADHEVAFQTGQNATIGFYIFHTKARSPSLDEFAQTFIDSAFGHEDDDLKIRKSTSTNEAVTSIEYKITEQHWNNHVTHLKIAALLTQPVPIYSIASVEHPEDNAFFADLPDIAESLKFKP